MQRLEVSDAVRSLYWSLGVKGLIMLRCGELEWPWVRDSLACAPGVGVFLFFPVLSPGGGEYRWVAALTPGAQARESRTQGHSSPQQSSIINTLTPNDHYSGRTASLTSKRCILYIYSTNIGTEYFNHGIHSSFFSFKMQFGS